MMVMGMMFMVMPIRAMKMIHDDADGMVMALRLPLLLPLLPVLLVAMTNMGRYGRSHSVCIFRKFIGDDIGLHAKG